LPILVIVPISFSSAQYLSFPPPGLSLQWYERFLGRQEWLDSIWLSLKVAVMSTAFTLVLGTLAAVALVRHRFRGKTLVYAIILSPMIVPTIISAIAIYFLFARLGLVGTTFAMAIGHTVVALPLVVIAVSSVLQQFDIRLEHAAVSLGATPWTAFRRVTLPLVFPGVMAGGLFAFLTSFDELLIPLFLSGPTSLTLPVRMWNSMLVQVEPTIAAVASFMIAVAVLTLIAANLLRSRRVG